jgi:hypothetical protein
MRVIVTSGNEPTLAFGCESRLIKLLQRDGLGSGEVARLMFPVAFRLRAIWFRYARNWFRWITPAANLSLALAGFGRCGPQCLSQASSVRRVIENKRSRRWRKYVFKSNVDSSQQSVVQVRCAPERIDYPKNISPAWTRRSRVGEPSPPSHRPCVLMLLKSYRRQPSFWPVTSIFVHRKRSRHVVLLSS